MYEVVLEREDCTMCGNCVELDETLFTFDDDDRATIIGSNRQDDVDELIIVLVNVSKFTMKKEILHNFFLKKQFHLFQNFFLLYYTFF